MKFIIKLMIITFIIYNNTTSKFRFTTINTYDNFLNFSSTELSSLEVLLRKLGFSDEGLLDVPLKVKIRVKSLNDII